MGGAGAPPQLFQFWLSYRSLPKMSKNVKPNKCQAARYSTIAEMEWARLDASTIANNVAMASQVSRRKKIRTCGCDQHKRKKSVRDRLLKKLHAKEAKKST